MEQLLLSEWTIEGALGGAAGALVAYSGVELALRPMAIKTPSAPRAPRWDLFAVFNAAACLAGTSALLTLWKYLPTSVDEAAALKLDVRAMVAALTLAVSATYAIAFCGVSLVWRAIEDDTGGLPRATKASPEAATRMAEARRQRLKDDNMDADVIIVGAGTAGATLAAVLGRQGRHVLLLERSDDIPERTVGELLQPGGQAALERMGLGCTTDATAIDSVAVDGYVCITPGGCSDLLLSYPDAAPASAGEHLGFTDGPSSVALGGKTAPAATPRPSGAARQDSSRGGPPRGRAFWNHRFVHQLRALARAEPLVQYRLASVRSLLTEDDDELAPGDDPATCRGVRMRLADGSLAVARARLVVLADGMFSVMRHALGAAKPEPASTFVGYLLHHAATAPCLPYPNRGHVVMADPNPVLLYQITPKSTRILVDVPGKPPMHEPGWTRAYMETRILPQLPASVQPAFREALRTQEPVACVNKRLPPTPSRVHRALLLGDSWNMRHPLTGGGMTVALRDVETLALCLEDVDIDRDDLLVEALDAFRTQRQGHAATVNVLANALHRVFTKPDGDDGTRAALREACVEYLKLGGASTAGPVSLLSALTPKPLVLVSHFFLVALFATRRALLPCPTPRSVLKSWRLMQVACMIIMPLAEAERVAPLNWPVVRAIFDMLFPWSHGPSADGGMV